jgi:transposase
MKRSRHYDDEFKREAVSLVKSTAKTNADIARELGIPSSTLCGWTKESKIDSDGEIITDSEITKLRRELAETRLERDILKKAVAIFSKVQK